MRISDRSSDVCSSDLKMRHDQPDKADRPGYRDRAADADADPEQQPKPHRAKPDAERARAVLAKRQRLERAAVPTSEEHTSELQSLMRISHAVCCLSKQRAQSCTTFHRHGDVLSVIQ